MNGKTVNFSICRNGEATRNYDQKEQAWGTVDDTFFSGERISLSWQKGDIAILQINSFEDGMIPSIDSLAKAIVDNKAKGLIIDLRYNGGGTTNVARHLQWYLTNMDSIKYFGSQIRINDSYGRSQGNYRKEYEDFYKNKAYKTYPARTIKRDESIAPFIIPVAILCGRYTFSAAEDFMVNIYEMPNRPVIIGEPTGGSTGAPLMVTLPNETMARICSVRFTYPYSGNLFVGKGVQPDVYVEES